MSRSRSRSKSARDESEKEHKKHEENIEITGNIKDTSFKTNFNEKETTLKDENEYKASINVANPTRMTRSKLNVSINDQNNES